MQKIITLITVLLIMLTTGLIGFAQETAGSFYTAADGAKIYYEIKGDGFPVVLIHGFSGTGQGWKSGHLYPDLLAAGYKVIILDGRGNGRSDKPHTDAGYANDAEAKDIIGLISSLGIKKYNVVGYSRGSIIASRLLVLDNRVQKLVMGGMGDAYTNPEWPRRVHAYKALMGDTSFHDVDGMVKYIRSNPAFDVPALALQQKYQPSTSPQELSKVNIPVLLINGTEDHDGGSETELHKMIATSKLSYVPGNHNAASKTVQFSASVMEFFK